jgi:hypothetical protein
MDNNQPMSLSDFLIRVGLWGGLGYLGGLRGSGLKNWTFLGPISEQIFDYSLEGVVAAMERERQKKEHEAAIERERQKKEREAEWADLVESFRQIDFSLPKVNETGSLNSVFAVSPKQSPAYSKWREVIKHPAIVLVLGGRGSGKSAVSYRVIEDFRYSLSPYVVGFPEQSKELLPNWISIERKLEDVPPKSISIVDEAYLSHHAREWQKIENRDICRLLNLSRQTKFDRPEFRDILTEAKEAFQTVKGDIRRWSYVYSQGANFSGLIENELPTFWRPKLSKVYANSGDTALPRLSPEMTREEKKQKAKELHEAGWPQSKIAEYLGVASKGTIFNWIHGYPYKK